MLVNIAIGLLIAAVVLFAIRIILGSAVAIGKFLIVLAIILLIAAAVVGLISPFTS